MNISVLNNSVQVSIDIDTDGAVNAIATNAAMVAYNVIKFTLDRAVEDSRKVYGEVSSAAAIVADKAKRDINTVFATGQASGAYVEDTLNSNYDAAKATLIDAIASSQEIRDAVIAATKVKVAEAFDANFVKPAEELAAQVTTPVMEQVAILEDVIADYTRIDEVEAIAEEVQANSSEEAFSEDWGNKAVEAAKQGHVLVGDQVITENGITDAIAVTEAVEEVQPKTSGLSKLIREEVAKR